MLYRNLILKLTGFKFCMLLVLAVMFECCRNNTLSLCNLQKPIKGLKPCSLWFLNQVTHSYVTKKNQLDSSNLKSSVIKLLALQNDHLLTSTQMKGDEASGIHVQIEHVKPSSKLLHISIKPSITSECWDLSLKKIRNRQAQNSNRLHLSASDLISSVGGMKVFIPMVLQTLVDKAVHEAVKISKIWAIGQARFKDDLSILVKQFQPGSEFQFSVIVDVWPKVQFKKPYTGFSLRIPKPPYPKGLMWNQTAKLLRTLHAIPSQTSKIGMSEWGDQIKISILQATIPSFGSKKEIVVDSSELPNDVITVILEPGWNPTGLAEGLLGMAIGENKTFSTNLPAKIFSNKFWKSHPYLFEKIYAQGLKKVADASFYNSETFKLSEDSMAKLKKIKTENAADTEMQVTSPDTSESTVETRSFAEFHEVPVHLTVNCHNLHTRIPPELDDAFFLKLCNSTKEQVFNAIETSAEKEVENRCNSARRALTEQELMKCIDFDIPETLINSEAQRMWKKYKERKKSGDEAEHSETVEAYEEWRKTAVPIIEKQLKIALAIRTIRLKEDITVDEEEVMRVATDMKQKLPKVDNAEIFTQIYSAKEFNCVLDWLSKQAKMEYYVDVQPVRLNVTPPAIKDGESIIAYPDGIDVTDYEKKRVQKLKADKKFVDWAKKLSPSTSQSRTWEQS